MPKFQIDWIPNIPVVDDITRFNGFHPVTEIVRLKLNDEYAIGCTGPFGFPIPVINLIKIHRKSTAVESLVSGVITIEKNSSIAWNQDISQIIKTGSSFIVIRSPKKHYEEIPFDNECRMYGFLNITENRDEYANDLAKKEPKKNMGQKDLEELVEKESINGNQIMSLEDLSNDFKRLLDPKMSCFSDVTLKCGGFSIPAHKNILSARSPVFEAMFAQPMKESLKNEVDITDIDVSILRDLLSYIYTGKTTDLTISSAIDMLFAADKYQLQVLKRVCTDFMKDTVSLQNVLKVLVAGDMHAEDLKSFALKYICNQCVEFSVLEKTEEWKVLQKERPDLAMDVLMSLVKTRERKSKS